MTEGAEQRSKILYLPAIYRWRKLLLQKSIVIFGINKYQNKTLQHFETWFHNVQTQ